VYSRANGRTDVRARGAPVPAAQSLSPTPEGSDPHAIYLRAVTSSIASLVTEADGCVRGGLRSFVKRSAREYKSPHEAGR
jgi:hypothetical protein